MNRITEDEIIFYHKAGGDKSFFLTSVDFWLLVFFKEKEPWSDDKGDPFHFAADGQFVEQTHLTGQEEMGIRRILFVWKNDFFSEFSFFSYCKAIRQLRSWSFSCQSSAESEAKRDCGRNNFQRLRGPKSERIWKKNLRKRFLLPKITIPTQMYPILRDLEVVFENASHEEIRGKISAKSWFAQKAWWIF